MNTIFTLGYGAQSEHQAARDQLHSLKSATIIDTRCSPRSCFPAWCKAQLSREYRPRYVHIPALGNTNYRSGGPITLADEQRGLEQARKLLEQRDIILLCCCGHVETCHRRVIAERLSRLTGAPVCHLLQASPEQGQHQTAREASRRPRPRKPAQAGPSLWDV
jgi:uncharacterized protein (DUF488 family)